MHAKKVPAGRGCRVGSPAQGSGMATVQRRALCAAVPPGEADLTPAGGWPAQR
jgi:hypothetical protein